MRCSSRGRVRRSAARRAGRRARRSRRRPVRTRRSAVGLGRGVGHAPVRGHGSPGELGTHLAHPVAQRDHAVEARVDEAVEVLRAPVRRCRCPARPSPARRRGAAASGALPALRATTVWPLRSLEQRLGHLRARAVPGAEEQHAAASRPGARGAVAGVPGARERRDAARRRPRRAGRRSAPGRAGSRCRGRRPSCAATSRGPRRAAHRGGTRRGSGPCRQLGQLADPTVAPAQLGEQLPALGVGDQLEELERCGVRESIGGKVYRSRPDTSRVLDASPVRDADGPPSGTDCPRARPWPRTRRVGASPAFDHRIAGGCPAPDPTGQEATMAWDFSTDPEFQKKLDWVEEFCREEVEPLDYVFPYAVRSPDPMVKALRPEPPAAGQGPGPVGDLPRRGARRPRLRPAQARPAQRDHRPLRLGAADVRRRRARHREHGDARGVRHRGAEGALARSRCSTRRCSRRTR